MSIIAPSFCAAAAGRRRSPACPATRASTSWPSADGISIALQCKLHFSRPVGNKAVQEAHAAADFAEASHAGVVTNARLHPLGRGFGREARRAASCTTPSCRGLDPARSEAQAACRSVIGEHNRKRGLRCASAMAIRQNSQIGAGCMVARVVDRRVPGHRGACRSTCRCRSSPGSVAFTIVGLPDKAVAEARERVRAALIASGLALPAQAHHRQPRAGRPAQGGQPLRPADRARRDGGDRRDPGRRARRLSRCSASSRSTARITPVAGRAAGGDRRQWRAASA